MHRRPERIPVAALGLLPFCFGIAAHAQQERQVFDCPPALLPVSEHFDEVLDLDGDGFEDAVGVRYTGPQGNPTAFYQVIGYQNDGNGKLVKSFTFDWTAVFSDSDSAPRRVVRADFNGDQRDDFAVRALSKIGIFVSNGIAPPTLVATLTASDGGESLGNIQILAADFDGNGIDDVAELRSTDVRIFDKVMTTTPQSNVLLTAPFGDLFGNANQNMVAMDLTADGLPELLVGSGITNPTISAYSYSPSALSLFASWSLSLNALPLLTTGDIENDGDVDVVATSRTGSYQILRRTGGANFVVESVGNAPTAQGLIDLDTDGDLDASCADVYFPYDLTALFAIARNTTGTNPFGTVISRPMYSDNANFAGVADLEHDGDFDFLFDRSIFYTREPWADALQGFAPPEANANVDQTRIGDFDNDGDPDAWSRLTSFVRSRGDGTTELTNRPYPNPPVGTYFTSRGFSGDLDGDGDIDLVVHQLDASTNAPIAERLLENNGGGGFSDGGTLTAPGQLLNSGAPLTSPSEKGVTFVDIDNDGDRDAIASWLIGSFGATVQISKNVGGQFASSQSFSLGITKPEWILDLDGDGFPDFISILDASPGGLSVHFGSASGQFSSGTFPSIPSALKDFISYAVPADFDGDGDLDIAIESGNGVSNFVRMLEYVGNRTYAFHANILPDSKASNHVLLGGDLDLDSRPDLVTAESFGEGASVWFGTGAPGFQFTAGGSYRINALALADLEGDGDLDAIGSTLRRNPTHTPAEYGSRRQFGPETPGAAGQKPTLGASGDYRVGQNGSLHISGTAPLAPSLLFLGTTVAPHPPLVSGGLLQVFPFALAITLVPQGNPTENGSGRLSLPFVVPASVAGLVIYQQLATPDLAATQAVTWSNALEIRFAP